MFALVLQAGTLDNVTKTIGRLLDGYDIRLRPNFGGKFISQSNFPFADPSLNTNYWEPEFITGKYGSCDILDYRRSKILVSAESDRFIPFGVDPLVANEQ